MYSSACCRRWHKHNPIRAGTEKLWKAVWRKEMAAIQLVMQMAWACSWESNGMDTSQGQYRQDNDGSNCCLFWFWFSPKMTYTMTSLSKICTWMFLFALSSQLCSFIHPFFPEAKIDFLGCSSVMCGSFSFLQHNFSDGWKGVIVQVVKAVACMCCMYVFLLISDELKSQAKHFVKIHSLLSSTKW